MTNSQKQILFPNHREVMRSPDLSGYRKILLINKLRKNDF
jgi:hypothetical protein